MSFKVGKITYDSSEILGTGSTSTVFEGSFSGRAVAVKRIPKLLVKPCKREIELLIKLDVQRNIVRYFIEEVQSDPSKFFSFL
jgi:serine/threonine-protein kinase/endoribonuclease IRE1